MTLRQSFPLMRSVSSLMKKCPSSIRFARPLQNVRTVCTTIPKYCSKIDCNITGATGSTVSEEKAQELAKIPAKMFLAFTCEVCNVRNQKTISKQAYQKGVVIVKCDGCANNHLIADNLGWFTDTKKHWNIEDIMALKGETVRKISDEAHAWEIVEETVTQMKISDEK